MYIIHMVHLLRPFYSEEPARGGVAQSVCPYKRSRQERNPRAAHVYVRACRINFVLYDVRRPSYPIYTTEPSSIVVQ